MSIIRTEKLCRTYFKGHQEIHAVDDLDISIKEGAFVSVIGRSGSGKSTLMNLLGGLDSPDSGKIFVSGKDISRFSRMDLCHYRRYQVGMIFQSFNLIYSYTAIENIILALIFGGVPVRERKKRARQILERVGLKDRANHRPDELSGGETQRVAVARALANDPKILLADEPTGNLDSHTAEEIIALLDELNRKEGKTILMVTHDQDLAVRASDRVVRLLDGKIAEDKTTGRRV